MSWLEEIDCRAFGEADFWILFSNTAVRNKLNPKTTLA